VTRAGQNCIYIRRLSPYIRSNPCQKYRVHTKRMQTLCKPYAKIPYSHQTYVVLANPMRDLVPLLCQMAVKVLPACRCLLKIPYSHQTYVVLANPMRDLVPLLCQMATMVTTGGDLQPGCLADRLLTGLGQPQINP
jgi:hypothetical protein